MGILSNHALLRYLERVCNLDSKAIRIRMAKSGYTPNTDTAVLAYMQKVLTVDVEAVRFNLEATPEILKAIALKASSVSYGGVRFRIRDGVVITTIAPVENFRLRPTLKKHKWRGQESSKRSRMRQELNDGGQLDDEQRI